MADRGETAAQLGLEPACVLTVCHDPPVRCPILTHASCCLSAAGVGMASGAVRLVLPTPKSTPAMIDSKSPAASVQGPPPRSRRVTAAFPAVCLLAFVLITAGLHFLGPQAVRRWPQPLGRRRPHRPTRVPPVGRRDVSGGWLANNGDRETGRRLGHLPAVRFRRHLDESANPAGQLRQPSRSQDQRPTAGPYPAAGNLMICRLPAQKTRVPGPCREPCPTSGERWVQPQRTPRPKTCSEANATANPRSNPVSRSG